MNQITLSDYEKASESFKSKFKEKDKDKWIYKSLGRLLTAYAHDRTLLIERPPCDWQIELVVKLSMLGFSAKVKSRVDFLEYRLIKEEV